MSHGDFALPAESLTSEVLQEIIESQGIAFYKVDTHTIAALQSLGSQGRNNVTNLRIVNSVLSREIVLKLSEAAQFENATKTI
jgi:hypothetical protein